MTPEQKAAFVMAQVASAIGQIFAMHAENANFHFSGEQPPNDKEAYAKVIADHGLGHNQVIAFFDNDR